jgi:SAM-dependent methyltransferase
VTAPQPTQDTPESHRWHRATDYERLASRIQFRNAVLVSRLHRDPASVRTAYEIGCGTGGLTAQLVAALPNASIDAVDVSAQMLTVARAKPWPDRVRFTQAAFPDVEPAGAYDAVFSNAALHWTYPRYPEVFGVVRRMLHPGGVFCAATAGRTRGTDEFGRFLADRLAGLVPDGPLDSFRPRRLDVDQILALADGAGLETDDAFIVERSETFSAGEYARWWVASGVPWRAGHAPTADTVSLITDGLGGAGAPLTIVHASVVMLLRRPASRHDDA